MNGLLDRFEIGRGARDEQHMRAPRGERLRRFRANAPARAGDQRDASLQWLVLTRRSRHSLRP